MHLSIGERLPPRKEKTLIVAMRLIIFMFSMVLSLGARALTVEESANAAQAAGFELKALPKPGESYVTTKTKSKKNFTTFKTFAHAKTSNVDQISVMCNQCESKKISEATSILCYEDVQAVALKLKLDLPGGVIRAFENVKSQQQVWESTDKKAKRFRYTKTQVACGSSKDEGLKFDLFF